MPHELDVNGCRRQFPALAREFGGRRAVYFDGPAGSQVPGSVIEAVGSYLANLNANCCGVFATSRESDALLEAANRGAADFLGTDDADAIVFGPNMTSLTFTLARSLARTWGRSDEILLTRLEHDANVTPWVMAASQAGATVRHVDIRVSDCTLDLEDLERKLSERTRLVAVGCVSNAVGTINPVREIIGRAHAVGAEVFLDAVHHAPHLLTDVTAWDCDYLVCSAYKFFGPHVGLLWGKSSRLAELPVEKVRPAPDGMPGRWMTGTQNHEGIAGTLAAVEYLADLGRSVSPAAATRRDALIAAYDAIGVHERRLCAHLLRGLAEISGVKVHGITDPERLRERVPTVSFTHQRLTPREVAEHLAREGIFVWHGNYYALPLTETLGVEPDGMVRVGLLHYNSLEEVDRLVAVLGRLA